MSLADFCIGGQKSLSSFKLSYAVQNDALQIGYRSGVLGSVRRLLQLLQSEVKGFNQGWPGSHWELYLGIRCRRRLK
jgi:hypothetical protein